MNISLKRPRQSIICVPVCAPALLYTILFVYRNLSVRSLPVHRSLPLLYNIILRDSFM